MVTAHDVKDLDAVSPDWEQQFSTDEVIYYKTPEMHRLDEHFGDLQNIIIGKIRVAGSISRQIENSNGCRNSLNASTRSRRASSELEKRWQSWTGEFIGRRCD